MNYKNHLFHNKIMLAIELLCTAAITVTVAFSVRNGLYRECRQYTSKVSSDYQAVINSYVSIFETMVIPIEDKIKENPDFDDMQSWLQGNEDRYTAAIGADVYDGIAFTYKGGYAHSWNYGDYSDYDPTTRPWYQQAEAAAGDLVVVAPYVTYLDPSYFEDDGYILMSIAMKYNDEIYFDLDLKISAIKELLANNRMQYSGEELLLYDKDGYILSCNDITRFAHNLYAVDDVITESFSESILNIGEQDALALRLIDGSWQYVYQHQDDNGNTVCMMIPFEEVFVHNFLILMVISLLLVAMELYLYVRNKRNTIEFMERDKRLSIIADTVYKERLYVNVDKMQFYGNDTAGQLCRNGTYDELYSLIKSRMDDESEYARMDAFLSPEVLKNTSNRQYIIDSERFMMKMLDKNKNMSSRTIEVSRFAFTRNRIRMVCIAMKDASESADSLKEALTMATQASQAKGNFLSKMSHEIRTPLNAIIGYMSIAQDSGDNLDKIMHCIDNGEVAARHLLQIINDILDMSSIESGKLKIACEDFDLKKEITDITTIFYQNAKAKGVRFETQIDRLAHEWVKGDQLRLNQVLMNLLSNAVKFTPENGVVKLVLQQLDPDNGDNKVYIKFTVSDTGIGMSKEYMTRLFQPFEQEQADTARRYGGSGLGLSITKNLVEMMGGTVEVDSRQNEGTTFTVTMHFGQSDNNTEVVHECADYSHVRALVVDDEKDEGTYVKAMLRRCGVKSDSVTSGEAAIKRLKSRSDGDYKYDLCILDWCMPDMNGVEVASCIRKEFGDKLPIIIATAYDISEFEEEAKAAGVDRIISKPLFQSTLFNLLVSAFGKYDPQAGSTDKTETIDMSGVHVILAEDNDMNMEIAVTILEKAGIKVDQAVNGREAVELFTKAPENTYDMILMDVQMPVMNGYEATQAIRHSNHPEAETIPIIAMTANAFAEDVAEALAGGMNAHIAKPVNYEKMFTILKKFAR